MDFIDHSSELADIENENLVKAARARASIKRFPFIGKCYNCEAELTDRNFCDVACRDEYEEFKKRKI